MMHAQGVKRDRAGDDQFVVAVIRERRGVERLWREQLGVGVGDPAGRLRKAFILDVRTEGPEELSGGTLDAVVVDLVVGGAAGRRCSGHEARNAQAWRGHDYLASSARDLLRAARARQRSA